MKAVVYCRSRPGEPAASELALRRQREAVQQELEEGCKLVAEFTEHEGEAGSAGYPAFRRPARGAERGQVHAVHHRLPRGDRVGQSVPGT